jgi:hypothetical protein
VNRESSEKGTATFVHLFVRGATPIQRRSPSDMLAAAAAAESGEKREANNVLYGHDAAAAAAALMGSGAGAQ